MAHFFKNIIQTGSICFFQNIWPFPSSLYSQLTNKLGKTRRKCKCNNKKCLIVFRRNGLARSRFTCQSLLK